MLPCSHLLTACCMPAWSCSVHCNPSPPQKTGPVDPHSSPKTKPSSFALSPTTMSKRAGLTSSHFPNLPSTVLLLSHQPVPATLAFLPLGGCKLESPSQPFPSLSLTFFAALTDVSIGRILVTAHLSPPERQLHENSDLCTVLSRMPVASNNARFIVFIAQIEKLSDWPRSSSLCSGEGRAHYMLAPAPPPPGLFLPSPSPQAPAHLEWPRHTPPGRGPRGCTAAEWPGPQRGWPRAVGSRPR